MFKKILHYTVSVSMLAMAHAAYAETDPLPSWNEGEAKSSVLAFVERVTAEASPDFVPPEARIATFDNDGTLWAEQPVPQLLFALDRLKTMAPDHPEWKTEEPFASALAGDMNKLVTQDKEALIKMLATAHSGMTTDEFAPIVRDWLETSKNPTTEKPHTEMIYTPMLELLEYLRANEFRTYIVSGGGADFIRVFANDIYGIPPEQVIGSEGKVSFEIRENKTVLLKLPELDYYDNHEGKAEAIYKTIGQRPIAAFGNTDGDLQMLQWACGQDGPNFCLYVHHTDADREWEYGSEVGTPGALIEGLQEAETKGWTVVDMKADWNRIFPDETAE